MRVFSSPPKATPYPFSIPPVAHPRTTRIQASSSTEHPSSMDCRTRVGNHSLLQAIFLTQGSNLGLLHCRQILYCLSHQGSPHNHTYLVFKSRPLSSSVMLLGLSLVSGLPGQSRNAANRSQTMQLTGSSLAQSGLSALSSQLRMQNPGTEGLLHLKVFI